MRQSIHKLDSAQNTACNFIVNKIMESAPTVPQVTLTFSQIALTLYCTL